MWTMLAGVPGKLKTLLDRLTATRAANLDHLNADVSSRAPAATALSSDVWTPGRAAKLDDILPSVLKSVQTAWVAQVTSDSGTNFTENNTWIDISVSSVNPAKSIVLFDGGFSNTTTSTGTRYAMLKSSATEESYICSARLTSSTNLRISSAGATSGRIAGRWTIIEFH